MGKLKLEATPFNFTPEVKEMLGAAATEFRTLLRIAIRQPTFVVLDGSRFVPMHHDVTEGNHLTYLHSILTI